MLKKVLGKIPVSAKFSNDVSWNLVSLAVVALVGVSLNVLILKVYGASVLGVFNQAYAVYVLLSQLSVMGLQLAVSRYAAVHASDRRQLSAIVTAALSVAALAACGVVVLAVFLQPIIPGIFQSPDLAGALPLTFPALILFSLNKILLFFHNGCRRMKAYAVFQALRFLSLLAALVILMVLGVDGKLTPGIFLVAESVLFLALWGYSSRYMRISFDAQTAHWCVKLVRHGIKAMGGNMLYDMNTRVDVIMLGVFSSDRLVGVYSFVAMLMEGFHQVGFVFQSHVNPLLTRVHRQGEPSTLTAFICQGRRLTYLFMVPLGVLLLAGFPLVTRILNVSSVLAGAGAVLTVLMAGSLLSVGYRPFFMLFNQTGFPFLQTGFFTLTFLSNVFLNVLLIPRCGILGAALATAASWLLQVVYLKRFARVFLNLKL